MKDKQYMISGIQLKDLIMELINDEGICLINDYANDGEIDCDNQERQILEIVQENIRDFLNSKKPVDTLDRANVGKIFKPAFTEISNAPRSWDDNSMKSLYVLLLGIKDNILSLIPKQQSWNEKNIREILDDLWDRLEHYDCKYNTNSKKDLKKLMVLHNKVVDKAISQLSQLKQGEVVAEGEIRTNLIDNTTFLIGGSTTLSLERDKAMELINKVNKENIETVKLIIHKCKENND